MLALSEEALFRLVGTSPLWFRQFYPDIMAGDEVLRLSDNISFVENFLIDANDFWANNTTGRLKSGIFIETDLSGNEYAVEASAVVLGGEKIILFELAGTSYDERKNLLQRARENTLIRDYLEDEIRKRTADIRRREEEIALRLVSAVESRDKDTGEHIRRIGLYSAALAKAVGWSQSQIDDIFVAATMHDIGKIGIPDYILQKSGKLTPQEYEIMKNHTEIGATILEGSDVPLLKMAKDIAMFHHEKWDGSGYPNGLRGESIPLCARIVSIADVFDALVSQRVYKSAGSESNAVDAMTTEMRAFFDPEIFECFIELLPTFQRIREDVSGS